MEDLMQELIHQANDCIHINLLRPASTPDKAERILDEPFNPTWSYPIVGDEQLIVGYKNPKINLDFRANDLRPSLAVKYDQKTDLSSLLGEQKQVDIDTVFQDFMPQATSDPAAFSSDPTSSAWKPPGKLLQSFGLHGKQYEIWSTSLADPAGLEIWCNMEILVLLFIEGASKLELDDAWTYDRWSLHLLYEVTALEDPTVSPYTIAGFATSHRYWIFPTLEVLRSTKSLPSPPASSNGDATEQKLPRLELAPEGDRESRLFKDTLDPLQAPSRERISQFLILPPYQGQSLGSRLYETLFGYYVNMPNIYEIPVEDPSEAFDAMRDYSDIVYLRTLPAFKNLSIASSLPPEVLKGPIPREQILGNGTDLTALRHESKIVRRQFNRLVELHLLSTIPPSHRNRARLTRKHKASNENDRKYYFWRLAVKDRIYQQSADVLDEMRKDDPKDVVDKLEDTVDEVVKEYEDRLKGIDAREKWASSSKNSRNAGGRGRELPLPSKRKRTVVEDDEDDWEDEDEQSVASSKKVKV